MTVESGYSMTVEIGSKAVFFYGCFNWFFLWLSKSVLFYGCRKWFSSMAVESGFVLWLSKVVLFYGC